MSKTMSADALDAALPWYAAGTLDAREADQIEAALAADNALAGRLDSGARGNDRNRSSQRGPWGAFGTGNG